MSRWTTRWYPWGIQQLVSTYYNRHRGGGGAKVGFELREENWSLEIGQIWTWGRKLEFGNLEGGMFCQRSDSDSGEENWSLEIWGGVFCQRSNLDSGKKIGVWKFGECSAKGQIWTWGRKLEFGNFFGGGVFCQRSDLDLGKKIGVWKFFGGVFCQRSDLDLGKKIGVWKFGGGVVFCQRSDLDSGKKIGVWKFEGGCSAKGQIWTWGRKLEFGNLGGCSAKGQIWTWGRKLEFGNLGGCSGKGQIWTGGRKLELEIWGGVFWTKFLIRVFWGFWTQNLPAHVLYDFASQIVSHILRLWRLIRKVNGCWMGDKCFWSVCSSNQIANCCSLCRLYVVYFSVSLTLNAGYLNVLIRNIGYG